MILNRVQIERLNIIEPFNRDCLRNASYDLSVEKIITMDSKEHLGSIKVKPQEMVWVICKERLKMPLNIVGFAHIKTELTKKGMLSMNTGIIDPGYNGYISTLLINFGKTPTTISKGMCALRITFANVNEYEEETATTLSKTEEVYLREIKESTDNFDKTFLNMRAIDTRLTNIIIKKFFTLLAILAALSGVILLIRYVIELF